MAELTCQAGEVIVREGDAGSSAYLLKSGRVEISKEVEDTRIVLAVLETGQVFGEMSLLDEQPRSATVTTLEPCVLEEVDQEEAEKLIQEASPLLRSILTDMIDRIRGMDEWALSSGVNLAQTPVTSVTLSGSSGKARSALGGGAQTLTRFPYRVGRSNGKRGLFSLSRKDLSLEDDPPYTVSRNHLAITRVHEDIFVVDEGSTVGTMVNGTRIGGPTSIREACCDQQENLLIVGSEKSPFQFQLTIHRE